MSATMETRQEKHNFFSTSVTKDQSKDTGLAFILILLIVGGATGTALYYKLAIAVTLLIMTVPEVLKPLAVVWFGISHLMGSVMSQVLLSIIFTIVVVPIAFLRKLAGKDSLQLKHFKIGHDSALITRNHRFTPADFEKPY
jgi:hypothetical protein